VQISVWPSGPVWVQDVCPAGQPCRATRASTGAGVSAAAWPRTEQDGDEDEHWDRGMQWAPQCSSA
jgi:hypothetical protein